jgi:hypothetical protein
MPLRLITTCDQRTQIWLWLHPSLPPGSRLCLVSFSPYLHCATNNIKRAFFFTWRGISLFLPTISFMKHPSLSSRFKIATHVSSAFDFKKFQRIGVRVNPIACRPSDTKPAHSCGRLLQPQRIKHHKPVCLQLTATRSIVYRDKGQVKTKKGHSKECR